MRENWTYKKLGEVCNILNGFAFKSGNYTGQGIRVMRITNVQKGLIVDDDPKYYPLDEEQNIEQYMLKEDDLLMSLTGNVGRVGLLQKELLPAALNQRVACIRITFNDILLKYVFHFLNSDSFERDCIFNATGIAQKNMSTEWLKKYIIPVPSLSEQQSIVAELDKINELISLKKAQLSDLDALAQSIFYDMFGDIDDDTPLSHFISSLGGGKSLAGKDSCINKVLKTGAVSFDYFDGNSVKDLPLDYVPLQEHLLKDGDLLVSRMNTPELVGSCAYVWKAPNNTYLPDRLWRATLKQGNNPIYLWFSIIQLKSKEQIRSLASGTSGSMKNISKPRFLSVKIKNAPLSLQQEFAERIELIEQQKAQISSTKKDLEKLLESRMQYWFD